MAQRVRVAVVTGGNKGIGLAIVRSLCRQLGEHGVVYLTARDEGRGREAVELLQKEGLSPKFHILDITDKATIDMFRCHLEKAHGGLDILINCAGIGTPRNAMSVYERNVRTMKTNFFGLVDMSHALIPLIRSGGRVVNIASTTPSLVFPRLPDDLKARFRQISDEQDVVNLMNEYIAVSKAGTNAHTGWPEWGYAISKLGVVALTVILARDIMKDDTRHDILINSCCPGFCATDMTVGMADDHFGGTRVSATEGAVTPTFLALLPKDSKQPHGQFLLRQKVYDFINNDMFIQP